MNYNEFVDDILPEVDMEGLDGFIPNEKLQPMDDLIDSESDTEIHEYFFLIFKLFSYFFLFFTLRVLFQ